MLKCMTEKDAKDILKDRFYRNFKTKLYFENELLISSN
jgi:hypothetical protein